MKRPLAAIGTLLVMAGMLWVGMSRSAPRDSGVSSASAGETPVGGRPGVDLTGASERIEELLADAERGDVDAYLAAFVGPIRDRLARQADERGRAAFAEELRRAAGARKSHAVFEPEPSGDGPDGARVAVESTFADRIERQTFRLVRVASGWVINDVETARDHLPRNALGATATFQEPEGPPVPLPGPRTVRQDESIQEPP
jgi:hypothetical protein